MKRLGSIIQFAVPCSLLFPLHAFAQDADAEDSKSVSTSNDEAEAVDMESVKTEAEAQDSESGFGHEIPVTASEAVQTEEQKVAEAEATLKEAQEEVEPGPSLLPLKVGTHTFSRFEYRQNYDVLGVSKGRFQEGDQTVFRARLIFETNPLSLGDNIEGLVKISPQASGNWGNNGTGGTIGALDAGLYEGYFEFRGERFDGKVGRISLNYGDGMLIGNLDWNEVGRAFDGIQLRTKLGKGWVDALFTQTAEGYPLTTQPFFGNDAALWGAYAALGENLAEGLALDVYALGKTRFGGRDFIDESDDTFDTTSATRMTFGARVKQRLGFFDYRLEGGVQVGKSPVDDDGIDVSAADPNLDDFAYNVDGDVGLNFSETTRLGLGGVLASGDNPSTQKDEGWDQLYPTAHKFLGLMDVIGKRDNVASVNLKLQTQLGTSTTFKADLHAFWRLEQGGFGQSGDGLFTGGELDAQVIQQIGKWGYARGLYGIFVPMKDYFGSSQAAHYTEIQAGLKF